MLIMLLQDAHKQAGEQEGERAHKRRVDTQEGGWEQQQGQHQVPITVATIPSPAAMAAAAGMAAALVTARTVTAATVGRASEKEVWCTWTRRQGPVNANWGLERQTAKHSHTGSTTKGEVGVCKPGGE